MTGATWTDHDTAVVGHILGIAERHPLAEEDWRHILTDLTDLIGTSADAGAVAILVADCTAAAARKITGTDSTTVAGLHFVGDPDAPEHRATVTAARLFTASMNDDHDTVFALVLTAVADPADAIQLIVEQLLLWNSTTSTPPTKPARNHRGARR